MLIKSDAPAKKKRSPKGREALVTSTTISELVDTWMTENNISQKAIENLTKSRPKEQRIKQSFLSSCLKNETPFTLNMVIVLAELRNEPFDYYFPYYANECFAVSGGRLRKKSAEFINYCISHDCFHHAVVVLDGMIEEGLTNGELLFETAENLCLKKREDIALSIYNRLEGLETNRLSELLALVQYRRFSILRMGDIKQAYDAAIEFMSFLAHLPKQSDLCIVDHAEGVYHLKLEAYRKLIATFHVADQWDKMFELSRALEIEASQNDEIYFGLAHLYQGYNYRHIGNYEKSLQSIKKYGEIEGNEKYPLKKWAEGNECIVSLEMGNLEAFSRHLEWNERYPDEKVFSFPRIVEALYKHNQLGYIREFFEQYASEIPRLYVNCDNPKKKRAAVVMELMWAKYQLSNGNWRTGVESLLSATEKSIRLNLCHAYLQCCRLGYMHKEFMDKDQIEFFVHMTDQAIQLWKEGGGAA